MLSPAGTLLFIFLVWLMLPAAFLVCVAGDILWAIATRTLRERRERRQQRRELKAFEMMTHPAAWSKIAQDFVSGEVRK